MAALEIMEDLFFLERGHLNGNHFVYRSAAPVLIDTGYVGDFDKTAQLITGLGVALSQVRLIISTHCHCDHMGGNKIIQERSGCDIALHKIGKYFMDIQDDWSTWWRYYRQEADFFQCTRGLEDGEAIALGPHEFTVIHTPGHASDGIVLYEGKEKVLISSDTLWERRVATITVRVEGSTAVHALEASLERLAPLDVKVVFPGHGAPFTDFRAALERSRKKVKDYLLHPEKVGNDLLKRITIYTLLMKRRVREQTFLPWLKGTHWFPETVDLYFKGDYERKYHEIMENFLQKGVIKRKNGWLYTTVKP